jgi:YidC/Oxa1 family membrane protein insertase
LPNLEGPVYGQRSTDWILGFDKFGAGFVPPLGWHDTIAFLTLPILLVIGQAVSLKLLTPPSDDPAVQQSQVG